MLDAQAALHGGLDTFGYLTWSAAGEIWKWGMQVVNLVTNRVCRTLGKVENTERFLGLTLYQGIPGTGGRAKRLGAGITAPESDPMLVACAFNSQRLYLFSRREPPDTDEVATGRCARLTSMQGAGPPCSLRADAFQLCVFLNKAARSSHVSNERWSELEQAMGALGLSG